MDTNRQVVISSLPTGPLTAADFELRSGPAPEPPDGGVLCRTIAVTMGAGQRAGLQGSASYAGAPQAGMVMPATGVATVVASRAVDVPEGTLVTTVTGWQELSVQPAAELTVLTPPTDPATALGVLGTNGLTAWFGLHDIGQPQPGDTVLVSAAAGSVGHVVGQLAKAHGCRVVGVAGSPEKCRILTDELGYDVAVSHHDPAFRSVLKEATPDRIGVYFDNTGGPVLEGALSRMAVGGRIVCCGVVSQYDTSTPGPGPRGVPGLLVNNRVRMQGFLTFDYSARYDEARKALTAMLDDGSTKPRVTEFRGLEQAPQAFVDLLAGHTTGTTIVTL